MQRLPMARRARVAAASLSMVALVWNAAANVTSPLRDWLPAAYILVGYYITGWLFVAPSPRLESWLVAWDRRVLGDPATRFAQWPRAFVAYLEIVYMLCFLIVPAGFAALVLAVAPALPFAGAVFGLLAVSIGVACVVGRYHYVMDVAGGALLAVAAWVAVGLSGV